MSEDKHIIWSNYALDYEDWRAIWKQNTRSCPRMNVSL